MKFTVAAVSALLSTAIAAPSSANAAKQTYEIQDFTIRKINGEDISALEFHIVNKNTDVTCSPYSRRFDAEPTSFTSGELYDCGPDSDFSFEYIPESNKLVLQEYVSRKKQLTGNTILPEPICCAGPTSIDDRVCFLSGNEAQKITLRKL